MTHESWAAFAAASLALLVMPGPTNLVLVSYGLGLGRAAVWPAVLGVVLGRVAAMALAALGAGALLAASAPLLAGLEAAGIAYLAWLGVRLLRAGGGPARAPSVGPGPGARAGRAAGAGRVLRHVWLVTVVNPFNLAYFTALFPHALGAAERPWVEAATMAATFLGLSLAVSLAYGLLAARAHALWGSRRFVAACNRAGGMLLLAGALALAAGA